jgi:phosphate transport system substrate-binding protein
MNKMSGNISTPFLWVFLLTALIVLPTGPVVYAHDDGKDLRGETFTDPSKQFPMPGDWLDKRIVYDREAERADADLAIVMDQDIYYTLLPIIRKFGTENHLKIFVKEGTCGIAAGMLGKKSVDMGGFCCPPGAEDRLPGIRFHTMGIVATAFLVHPDNPVDTISSAQLRDIYRGKIYRWSELKTTKGLPGPNLVIKAIGRLHCQKRPGHWRQLLDTDNDFSPRLLEVGSIPDMIARVASSRDAIGWEVLTMAEKYRDKGAVKPLRINGYSPSDSEAVASLKYPFYRTYSLSTWVGKNVENKQADRLVEYMKKEFEKLEADKFGFVSQSRLRKAGWKFKGDELIGEPAPAR